MASPIRPRSLALAATLALLAGGCAALRESPPHPGREGYIPASFESSDGGSVRLYYRVLGSGPDTVVVVHGGPQLHMNTVAPDLEPITRGRTVILYDQRGGGMSETAPASLTVQRHLWDLERVRRYFRLGPMTLLGHGWGSGLAALYADDSSGAVKQLVMVSPFPPAKHPYDLQRREEIRRRLGTGAALQADSAWARWKRGEQPRRACREWSGIMRRAEVADPRSGAGIRGNPCRTSDAALLAYPARLEQFEASFGGWYWNPMMPRITARTLVVRGEADPAPARAAALWAATIPDARLVSLAGAGAYPHAERPEAFFTAVETFLRGSWPEGSTRPPAPAAP